MLHTLKAWLQLRFGFAFTTMKKLGFVANKKALQDSGYGIPKCNSAHHGNANAIHPDTGGSVNFHRTETCLRNRNNNDYGDIEQRTQAQERLVEKPGNKYSRSAWMQLQLAGINELSTLLLVAFNTIRRTFFSAQYVMLQTLELLWSACYDWHSTWIELESQWNHNFDHFRHGQI